MLPHEVVLRFAHSLLIFERVRGAVHWDHFSGNPHAHGDTEEPTPSSSGRVNRVISGLQSAAAIWYVKGSERNVLCCFHGDVGRRGLRPDRTDIQWICLE